MATQMAGHVIKRLSNLFFRGMILREFRTLLSDLVHVS